MQLFFYFPIVLIYLSVDFREGLEVAVVNSTP